MDVWTFLSGLKVSSELAAFVTLTVIFLVFRLYESREANKLQRSIAHAFDERLENLGQLQERVATSFQVQIREMDKRTYDNQLRYQEQLQVLTESHIKVSRESINALAKIEGAFNSQNVRLENVERTVSDFARVALPKPKRDGHGPTGDHT